MYVMLHIQGVGLLMSQKDKLVARLLKKPKDFTYDEMVSLLLYMGYTLKQGGF